MKSCIDRGAQKHHTAAHHVMKAGSYGPLLFLRISALDGVSVRPFHAPKGVAFHRLPADVGVKGNDTASRSSIDIAEEGEVAAGKSQNLDSHAARFPAPELLEAWHYPEEPHLPPRQ